MKLHENVETETSEKGVFNSRASRMARYSAAAAGVAAVSTLDVDAAMIKVIVTDPDAQGIDGGSSPYTLSLDNIRVGAEIELRLGGAPNWDPNSLVQMAENSFSSSAYVHLFQAGQEIGTAGGGTGWRALGADVFSSNHVGSSLYQGFRVTQEGGDYTYGWVNIEAGHGIYNNVRSYGYNSTLNAAAIAGQGVVSDTGPGIFGIALIGAGAAGVRLWRKLRAGK